MSQGTIESLRLLEREARNGIRLALTVSGGSGVSVSFGPRSAAITGLIAAAVEAVHDAVERLDAGRAYAAGADLRRALEAAGRLATLSCCGADQAEALTHAWGDVYPVGIDPVTDGCLFAPIANARKVKLWAKGAFGVGVSVRILEACGAKGAMAAYQHLCEATHPGRAWAARLQGPLLELAVSGIPFDALAFGEPDDEDTLNRIEGLLPRIASFVSVAFRVWREPSTRPAPFCSSASSLQAGNGVKTRIGAGRAQLGSGDRAKPWLLFVGRMECPGDEHTGV